MHFQEITGSKVIYFNLLPSLTCQATGAWSISCYLRSQSHFTGAHNPPWQSVPQAWKWTGCSFWYLTYHSSCSWSIILQVSSWELGLLLPICHGRSPISSQLGISEEKHLLTPASPPSHHFKAQGWCLSVFSKVPWILKTAGARSTEKLFWPHKHNSGKDQKSKVIYTPQLSHRNNRIIACPDCMQDLTVPLMGCFLTHHEASPTGPGEVGSSVKSHPCEKGHAQGPGPWKRAHANSKGTSSRPLTLQPEEPLLSPLCQLSLHQVHCQTDSSLSDWDDLTTVSGQCVPRNRGSARAQKKHLGDP